MKTLTTDQLQDMQQSNEKFELINVLSEDNFRATHIPGSKNIPGTSKDFEKSVEKAIGGKNKKVVLYCASQSCDASPKAAKKLEQAGFKNVYDYEGGTKSWQEAGLPIEGDAVHT